MQINLTGFLESKTPAFMSSLWALLLEAQDSPAGVPASFVQEKKEELRQKHEADERAFAEARRRGEHDLRLDEVRHSSWSEEKKLELIMVYYRFVNARETKDAVVVVGVAVAVAIRSVEGVVTRGGAIAVGEVGVET
jgi:hypothetical protein